MALLFLNNPVLKPLGQDRHLCQVGGQLLLLGAQSDVTEPEQREGSFHTMGGLVQCGEACTGCGGCLHKGLPAMGVKTRPGRRESVGVEIGN